VLHGAMGILRLAGNLGEAAIIQRQGLGTLPLAWGEWAAISSMSKVLATRPNWVNSPSSSFSLSLM